MTCTPRCNCRAYPSLPRPVLLEDAQTLACDTFNAWWLYSLLSATYFTLLTFFGRPATVTKREGRFNFIISKIDSIWSRIQLTRFTCWFHSHSFYFYLLLASWGDFDWYSMPHLLRGSHAYACWLLNCVVYRLQETGSADWKDTATKKIDLTLKVLEKQHQNYLPLIIKR